MSIKPAELQLIDDHAQRICEYYTCSIGSDRFGPEILGSGTVLVVGDYAMIATAMHVVQGYALDQLRLLAWYPPDDRRCPIPQDGRQFRDDTQDLAVLTMKREALERSRIRGLPLEQVEPCLSHDDSDSYLLCGSPCEKSQFNRGAELFEHTLTSRLMTPIPRCDWPKSFEAEIVVRRDPYVPSISCESGPTHRISIPTCTGRDLFLAYGTDWYGPDRLPRSTTNPAGFSGGGIWRLATPDIGESLSKKVKLAGIAIAVEKNSWRWIRGIQMQHWLEMIWSEWPGLRNSIEAAGLIREGEQLFKRKT